MAGDMAGSYQHYLQQMLQRGFKRSGGSKKRPSVWVYTKKSPVFSKRIESFGGEREFYSSVSTGLNKTLDDKITEWEAHRQADVREWRDATHGTAVDSEKAATLVGLTGVRTKALRQVLQQVIGEMLPKFGEAFKDPAVLLNHIENSKEIGGLIISQMKQDLIGPHENPEEIASSLEFKAMARLLSYAVAEVGSHALSKALRDLDLVFKEMLDSGEFDIEAAHKSGLEQHLDDAKTRADLLELNWWIARNNTEIPWVLPDCAIVEVDKEDNHTQFMLRMKHDRQALILPLSHDSALIGTVTNDQDIDLSAFNENAAACSVEFYVASQQRPEFDAFAETIGTKLSEGLVETMDSTLNDLYSLAPQKEFAALPVLENVNFQAHQLEISEDELRELAQQIASYLWNAGQSFDLSLLENVVICRNVAAAYLEKRPGEEIDLADDDPKTMIWWIEAGQNSPEYTLLMNISAAQVLCEPDHESFDFIYNLFMQNLAQIHVRAIALGQSDYQELSQLYINENVGWRIRDIALRTACAFMETLYGCRIEEIDIDNIPILQERMIDALDIFLELKLPDTSDVTENNARALALSLALEDVMYNTARYAALCEHLAISITDSEHNVSVRKKLETVHLVEWMHRLDLDFQRLRVNFSHPLDPERIVAIQNHTERLLWGRSMIIVAHESGGQLKPFIDSAIHYESIRCELEARLGQILPENISALIARSQLS